MQKVYLLLRNNRRSGPFTLAELFQQQPRPTDMVWIEGSSQAWAYVSELELRASDDNELPQTFYPGEIEQKAEELRKRALAAGPQAQASSQHFQQHQHDRVPGQESEEEIVLIDHRKDKNNILSELLMTVLIIALFSGGVLWGRNLFIGQKQNIAPAVAKTNTLVSTDAHAAARIHPFTIITDTTSAAPVDTAHAAVVSTPAPVVHPKAAPLAVSGTTDSSSKKTDTAAVVKHEEAPVKVKTEAAEPPKPVQEAKKEVKQDTPPPVVEEPRKKTLGQALRNLFHRKKDKD